METHCSGAEEAESNKLRMDETETSKRREQTTAKHFKGKLSTQDSKTPEETGNVPTRLDTISSKMDSTKTTLPLVPNSPTSREMLNQQAQILIDEVNAKRKRDTAVLDDFKKSLEIQTANAYSMVEQNVFKLYEENGKLLQEKLQELFATLDRIAKLEQELEQFRVALGALYQDIH